MQDAFTDKAIDQFAQLDLESEEEEEIEVIYVESLSGPEIVEFARYGELQIMEELVRLDLLHKLKDAIDGRGNTALHMASANGHLDVVLFILNVVTHDPIYINSLNHEQNTALHWACLNGHHDVAQALLNAGADHAIKNGADRLAFDEALQQNHESIMTLIADHTNENSTEAAEPEPSN